MYFLFIPCGAKNPFTDLKWHGNKKAEERKRTRMWINAQPDGRPAKYRWRPLFNATNFG